MASIPCCSLPDSNFNGGVSESSLNPPNEAVICGEQTVDLSLFGAGQMEGVEGSIAELLKIFGTLKRRHQSG